MEKKKHVQHVWTPQWRRRQGTGSSKVYGKCDPWRDKCTNNVQFAGPWSQILWLWIINKLYLRSSKCEGIERPLSRSWCCRILLHVRRLASLHRDLNAVNQTEAPYWYFQAMRRFGGVLPHVRTAQISLNDTKVWISRGVSGILIICFWTGSSAHRFERRGDLGSARLHGEHLVKIHDLVSRAKCFLCISVNHKYALCLSYAFHHLLCTIRFRLHVLQIRR